MSQALLVIDVQESFRHAPYWTDVDLQTYLAKQNELIAGARSAGIPVVRVFHVDDAGPFAKQSGWIKPLEGSDSYADYTVEKHVHSALVDTGLADWFKARGIDRLIVSGIRTEQCCETTTRHGSDLGFDMDYVTEATLTFSMQHASGRAYSSQEIKERTELVLARRFARIRTVSDVLADMMAVA